MFLKVALAREAASFWRENVVAVVILLRVLASGGNKLILQSGEVLTSFNNDNAPINVMPAGEAGHRVGI